ncbi:MAG: hypothetical protein J5940_05940, partial [Clostridia bacterium]|nr:hypothetical protein [Clostridia bacterium]
IYPADGENGLGAPMFFDLQNPSEKGDQRPLSGDGNEREIAEWVYFVAVANKSMTAQDLLIDNGEAAKANFVW